jgi:hypothetical protein
MHMKLAVEPLISLCDRKIRISVSGLPPSGKVRLGASMRFPWAGSVLYESFAWFTADSAGNVDVSKQKPDSGTYDFVDGMGPIISMRSADKNAIKKIGRGISVDRSLFIDFTAECDGARECVRVERFFMAPGMKVLGISDEFVGELYHTENSGARTIVFIGGSGSGLAVNSILCAAMAAHGFNVLSLPFFGEGGLPKSLSAVPLEYFERAFAWLEKNPITRCKEIQILCMSKGAEVGLILASRNPNITKVAAIAPHAYCFQGISFRNESSWTYQGKSLPYVGGKWGTLIGHAIGCVVRNEPFTLTYGFKKWLKAAKNKDHARIPVENARADFLFLVGKQNGIWNSHEGCVEIMNTLRKNNYPHKYDLVVYDDAGESFYAPYVIPICETRLTLAPRLVLFQGGTFEGNARAQVDAWGRILQFFGAEE